MFRDCGMSSRLSIVILTPYGGNRGHVARSFRPSKSKTAHAFYQDNVVDNIIHLSISEMLNPGSRKSIYSLCFA